MSYDIYFARISDSQDPKESITQLLEREEEESISQQAIDPKREALKHDIAQALIAVNPKFSTFEVDHEKFAKFENLSLEQAKAKYSNIELYGDEDGNEIQITLNDELSSLTVPYWHSGSAAKQVFEEIWKYVNVFTSGYQMVAYDPQIEDLITDHESKQRALTAYLQVMKTFPDFVTQSLPSTKKPWWKFW